MKTVIKILIFYIGFYLFASGPVLQCVKLLKSAVIELSDVDCCEDPTDEEDKSEDGKNEHKLLSGFINEWLTPLYSCTENSFLIPNDGKLSTAFSEIVPPPPKA